MSELLRSRQRARAPNWRSLLFVCDLCSLDDDDADQRSNCQAKGHCQAEESTDAHGVQLFDVRMGKNDPSDVATDIANALGFVVLELESETFG